MAAKNSNIFLLLGEDEYLLSQNQANLTKGYEESNTVSALEADENSLKNELLSLSFFALERVVIVDGLEKIDVKKGEAIEEVIAKIPQSTRVIFKARKLDGTRKWVKGLKGQSSVVECVPPKPYERRKIIDEQLAKLNLGPVEKSFLQEALPADLASCQSELEKLSLYPEKLDLPTLKLLIEPALEEQVFSLIDQLVATNWHASLSILRELLTVGNDPMAILGAILWQLRTLYKVSGLQGSTVEVAKALGLKEYPVRKAQEALRKLPFQRVEDWFLLALEADMNIKRGLLRAEVALEVMVTKMCLAEKKQTW